MIKRLFSNFFSSLINIVLQFFEVFHRLVFNNDRLELSFIGVGFNVSAIGVKVMTINQAVFDSLLNNTVKNLLLQLFMLIKSPTTILAESGVIGDGIIKVIADEPAIGQIHIEFFDQTSLAANAIDIANKEHLEKNNRVNGRTAIVMTIQGVCELFDEIEINVSINESKKVILGN